MLAIIRYLYYALFVVTPLLMISVTSEIFEFNKMMFIYFIATIVGTLWLLTHVVSGFKKPRLPTLIVIPFLIFLVSQVVSTLFSIDLHTSLFGYYGRFNGGLLSIIAYLVLFFVYIQVFEKKDTMKLLKISLVGSVIVILWGLPGKFGHDLSCLLFTGQFSNVCWTDQFHPSERMFSTLGQPNWLGAYLAINFFIGMYYWFISIAEKTSIEKRNFYLYLGYCVLNFMTILFTRSRSALGAIAVSLVLFALYIILFQRKTILKNYWTKLTAFALALVVMIVIFQTGIPKIDTFLRFGHLSPPPVQSKQVIASEDFSSNVTESFDIRRIVWKGALDLGLRYPLFGTGVETFAYSYYFTRPVAHNLTSEWDFLYNKAHNEILNYFATTGIFGVGSYLAVIGIVLYFFIQKIRDIKYSENEQDLSSSMVLFLLLAYLTIQVTNFTGFSTTTISLFFFLIPAFVITLASPDREMVFPERTFETLNHPEKTRYLAIIMIGTFIFMCLIKVYAANILYARALESYTASDYTTAAKRLQTALQFHHEHVFEDKLSTVLANIAFIAAYQKDSSTSGSLKETSATFINLSNFYNSLSIKESPKNPIYYKTTSKNDYLFYQINLDPQYLEKGIAALDQASAIAPTDPKLAYTKALFYSLLADEVSSDKIVSLKNQDASLAQIDRAITLKKNYRDAYFLKGQLLKKYGRKAEAQQIFQFMLKTFDLNDTDVKKELTD